VHCLPSLRVVALGADGRVFCWGENRDGGFMVPEGLVDVIDISCGGWRAAAVTRGGKVVCWGRNTYEVADDAPAGLNNVIAVSCNGSVTAALTLEGKVVCFGSNDERCTGLPLGLENVVAVSCFVTHVAAVTQRVMWFVGEGITMVNVTCLLRCQVMYWQFGVICVGPRR
jgi:hypothetical protein